PVVVVLAMAGVWAARASILRGVAERWVISDPLERADGIVVLGGRIDVRPSTAAALYKRGFASRILIANTMRDPLEEMQLWPGPGGRCPPIPSQAWCAGRSDCRIWRRGIQHF